jgi:hypothetical protein
MLSNVKQNIETNRKLRTKLYELLTKYIYKYIKKAFEKEKELHSTIELKPKLYPNFQRVLLQIPKWSSKTLEKEYNKFLKWNKKKNDIDTKELETMLIDIIKITTEIMLNKSSIYVETLLQDYKFPSLQQFYYKSLKKIARIIYEQPKSLYTIKTSKLTEQIENVLNIYLPTKQIESVLEFIEQDLDPSIKVKYNFENDSDSSKSSISLRKNSSDNNNLIIDKVSSLHYVSSDDLNHLKDTDANDDHISIKNNVIDEDNIKHIKIPKIKKSQYYYNKPKINEINEYFFNE